MTSRRRRGVAVSLGGKCGRTDGLVAAAPAVLTGPPTRPFDSSQSHRVAACQYVATKDWTSVDPLFGSPTITSLNTHARTHAARAYTHTPSRTHTKSLSLSLSLSRLSLSLSLSLHTHTHTQNTLDLIHTPTCSCARENTHTPYSVLRSSGPA